MADQNSIVTYSQPLSKRSKTGFSIPEDVIENILSFLPIKEVTTLSVLSKRFRYSWKFCRDLSFDRNFAGNLSSRDEYTSIVNNFFMNNLNTCADKFKLYYDATGQANLVFFWIRRAVSLGIKELELNLTPSGFILKHDIVDFESIKIMKLVNCKLHFPVVSNGGLRHLRELTLKNVTARPEDTQAIFVNCVSLKAMNLIYCNSIYVLKASAQHLKGFTTLLVKDCTDIHWIAINAPSLTTLHYHGKITKFKFYCDLPYLTDVILEIAHPRRFQVLSRPKEMVIGLAFVKILTVTSTFLEGLSVRFEDYVYKELEFFLWKLEELHLLVARESLITPSDITIFLKKCPCIERVFIDLGVNALGNSIYWENWGRHYLSKCQTVLPFLKQVKIKGFVMKEMPLTMARYFLKNAIHLECLVIVKARNHQLPDNYDPECLRWGIISNSRIEIYEYHKDNSTVMPQHLKGV